MTVVDPQPSTPHDLPAVTSHDYFSLPPPQRTLTFADEETSDDDIYRGEPREPPSPPRTPRPPSVSSNSSSSSSSSGSSIFGGRLGAISTIVERAISHWASAWASSSSLSSASSSSSSSSQPSIITATRSFISKRRRRRPSLAEVRTAKSELEVHARIRARVESKRVPREFVLYTPRTLEQSTKAKARTAFDPLGVLRTTSLPTILVELSLALKDNMKTRRAQATSRPSQPASSSASGTSDIPFAAVHDYMMPENDVRPQMLSQEDARQRRRGRKGKYRAERLPVVPRIMREASNTLDNAWWLDVASPTWEDMRAIGKLLHLHPLTLEDILQQEPREKLEMFPKLGYYFIVFRAIESRKSRQRHATTADSAGDVGAMIDEGFVGEVCVYLVIFREGIISFHFSDITEHADLVRSKVLALVNGGTVTMSSDWIAHGIMDSIVDSFFPFLEEIEKEILNIENVIFSEDQAVTHQPNGDVSLEKSASTSDTAISHGSIHDKEKEFTPSLSEKPERQSQLLAVSKRRDSLRLLKRLTLRVLSLIPRVNLKVKHSQPAATPNTVHRVAYVRRLVTSLSRFLATKSEVVAQVKKRILMTGEHGLGNGTGDDHDVFVYMGDVQDHILTLQQSLAHYERMLSQSHPIYLTHLRLSVSKAKAGSDKAILILTIISMAVLVVQAVLGFNSMNITLPHNRRDPTGRYTVFIIVNIVSLLVLALYGCVVRYWWVHAKRKRSW